MDLCQKKQAHLQLTAPADTGDMGIWRAMALPSRRRVVSHLSHERREGEAMAFLADFKARTDGQAPLFTRDKLPASLPALTANSSTPEPDPVKRGPGRPRKEPKRIVDPALCAGPVDKRREGGRVVDVRRQLVLGNETDIVHILQAEGGGSQLNTSYVERDNRTSRQSHGRLVRKTLAHSKQKECLQRHLDLEDAMFNFVRPHRALQIELTTPGAHRRRWEQRTPPMAAGLTDHLWSLEELLSYRLPSSRG